MIQDFKLSLLTDIDARWDDVLWAMWYNNVTPIKDGGIFTNYDKTKIGFSVDSTGFNYKPASDTSIVKTYWFAFK